MALRSGLVSSLLRQATRSLRCRHTDLGRAFSDIPEEYRTFYAGKGAKPVKKERIVVPDASPGLAAAAAGRGGEASTSQPAGGDGFSQQDGAKAGRDSEAYLSCTTIKIHLQCQGCLCVKLQRLSCSLLHNLQYEAGRH